jgi:hypothetical protein
MNILYIFVEIIKKSTNMKNLILTITFVLVSLVSFSQCPKVKSKMDSSVYHTYMTACTNVEFLNRLDIPYVSIPRRFNGNGDVKSHNNYFGDSFNNLPNDDVIMFPYNNLTIDLVFSNPEESLIHDLFMSSAMVTEYKFIEVNKNNVQKVLIIEYFYKWGENKNGQFSTVVLYQDELSLWNYSK